MLRAGSGSQALGGTPAPSDLPNRGPTAGAAMALLGICHLFGIGVLQDDDQVYADEGLGKYILALMVHYDDIEALKQAGKVADVCATYPRSMGC